MAASTGHCGVPHAATRCRPRPLRDQQENLGGSPFDVDVGKFQLRGCSFGSDEPSIALRPGLGEASREGRGVGVEDTGRKDECFFGLRSTNQEL